MEVLAGEIRDHVDQRALAAFHVGAEILQSRIVGREARLQLERAARPAVLMPTTSLEVATSVAERIRTVVADLRIEPLPEPITASFGVAERAAGEPGDELLRRADVALYEAKRLGRNRVIAANGAAASLSGISA